MSIAVRIASESAEDENLRLVFDAVLEGKRIKQQMCFGFVSEHGEGATKRTPILLRPIATGSREWVLDYGHDSKHGTQRTNVMERDIAVGNYFTVLDGPDEITIRIAHVAEL